VLDALRTDIIKSLALVEAVIDFGEDESLEEGVLESGRFYSSPRQSNLLTLRSQPEQKSSHFTPPP
jgi:tRNA U34 5-carboxymethylaminomethyl modifying GTPase MnmE/TrmE